MVLLKKYSRLKTGRILIFLTLPILFIGLTNASETNPDPGDTHTYTSDETIKTASNIGGIEFKIYGAEGGRGEDKEGDGEDGSLGTLSEGQADIAGLDEINVVIGRKGKDGEDNGEGGYGYEEGVQGDTEICNDEYGCGGTTSGRGGGGGGSSAIVHESDLIVQVNGGEGGRGGYDRYRSYLYTESSCMSDMGWCSGGSGGSGGGENYWDEDYVSDAEVTEEESSGDGQAVLTFVEVEYPSIQSIEFEDATDEHAFAVEVDISEGDFEVDECSIEAEAEGSTVEYNTVYDEDDEVCVIDGDGMVYYDDHSDWEDAHDDDDELLDVDVTVRVEDTEGFDDEDSDNHQFTNIHPEVQDLILERVEGEHAFNIEADLVFPGGGDAEFAGEFCVITLDGENTEGIDYDSSAGDFEVEDDTTIGGEDDASCSFESVEPDEDNCATGDCSGDFDFEVGESIDVEVRAVDHHEASDSTSKSHVIPNSPPKVTVVEPEDGALLEDSPVNLRAEVEDDEENEMEVEFLDSGGNLLYDESGVSSGDEVSYEWEVDSGQNYWTVNVNDSYDETIVTSSFRKVIVSSIRVANDISYDYSALIVPDGGSQDFFFEVENPSDFERDVKTFLVSDSLDVEFLGFEGQTHGYTLSPRETREFHVLVSGGDSGSETLEIKTEDDLVELNSTAEIPVFTRSYEHSDVRQVTGIERLNLLVLLFSALIIFLAFQRRDVAGHTIP